VTENASQKFKPTDKFTFKISNINSGCLADSACKIKYSFKHHHYTHHSLHRESHGYQDSITVISCEDMWVLSPTSQTSHLFEGLQFLMQIIIKKKNFVTNNFNLVVLFWLLVSLFLMAKYAFKLL
jgi:hypothetical protein